MSAWRAERERRCWLPRARDAFAELCPSVFPGQRVAAAVARRASQIDALPFVCWNGEHRRTITCCACGRPWNLLESQLWSVIDPGRVRCPPCSLRA